ncbi:MAG: YciI family protein [Planctomycetota bacterium]
MARPNRTVRAHRACALAASLALASCSSAPSESAEGPDARAPGSAVFTVVLLRKGEAPPELDPTQRDELSAGHFAFMADEAAAGRLLLTGPFGFEKAQEDLSGVFLFDMDDVDVALEVSLQDPMTRAGVFRQEAMSLATLDVLRDLPAAERARQERREAAGEDMSKLDLRSYVVLVADDGERAVDVIAHPALAPTVVLFGRLGPPRDGALFAVCAIEGAREARARLAIANEAALAFEVSDWLATPALATLGGRQDAPPTMSPSK